MPAAELIPIRPDDRTRVARFLHRCLNSDISERAWETVVAASWADPNPNHGYMLVAEGEVVGAYLAHYSEREIDGRRIRLCNLGAWCVDGAYRLQSLFLLRALLGQEGYSFVDLTPNADVVEIDRKLGFVPLATAATAVPCLPWPSTRGRIVSDPAEIERLLDGADLQLYRDHRSTPAVRHLAIEHAGRACYVAMRRDRRRRIPAMTLLHVSDPGVFAAAAGRFARHLLFRHRVLAYAVEEQILQHRPRLSLAFDGQPRMFRGDGDVDAREIDYLYSELACLP